MRRLLTTQLPRLAGRSLTQGPTGWDNTHWLVGDDLAVRLPRRRLAGGLVANEVRRLPLIAPQVPLPIPVPVHVGVPGDAWPWPWTVVPWFDGQRSDLARPSTDASEHATVLGRFLRMLHVAAPADAPHNPYRSVPLASRAARTEEALEDLARRGTHDRMLPTLRRAWRRGLEATPYHGPPTWIHGDLHPGNQLVRRRRLVAVVDWGDVAAGDPAADVATAWWTLPVGAHGQFRASYGRLDDDLWRRAAAWAAAIALYLLRHGPATGDDAIVRMAARTVDRLAAST